MEHHRDGEEDGGKDEQDLLLGLEHCSEEGVHPVQTFESVAHCTSKTWKMPMGFGLEETDRLRIKTM